MAIKAINRLDRARPSEAGLRTAFKVEYLVHRKVAQAEQSDFPVGPLFVQTLLTQWGKHFYFQRNKTIALFADLARWEIREVGSPCASRQSRKPPKLTPTGREGFTTQNVIGKIAYDIAMPGTSLHDAQCEDDLRVSVTQLAFALRGYQIERHGLPFSLSELVPRYLAHVPQDPFDGKPLRYLREKKMVYSVGRDGVDGGGRGDANWRQSEDAVFRLPF